jgi:hypothetical protein
MDHLFLCLVLSPWSDLILVFAVVDVDLIVFLLQCDMILLKFISDRHLLTDCPLLFESAKDMV